MSSIWLNEHRRNIHSQNGEDGVIEAILARIGSKNKWCCEFGAWDGIYLSNTYNLIKQGWAAVLIESDQERFEQLQNNMSAYERVKTYCEKVENLDKLLAKARIPKKFDLLSIDIDGLDYNVWRDVKKYEPRVVIIEVNSSLPLHVVEFPQEPELRPEWKRGATLSAMVALGKSKGYELAIHTGNAIFVQKEYAEALEIDTENWQELFDRSYM